MHSNTAKMEKTGKITAVQFKYLYQGLVSQKHSLSTLTEQPSTLQKFFPSMHQIHEDSCQLYCSKIIRFTLMRTSFSEQRKKSSCHATRKTSTTCNIFTLIQTGSAVRAHLLQRDETALFYFNIPIPKCVPSSSFAYSVHTKYCSWLNSVI